MYITICKIDSQWEFAVWHSSNQVLCDNLEGWNRAGGGGEIQDGEGICIPMADSRWCLAEANTVLLEKALAPHSSSLAWKIPWMEEPCRLQSMGSLRVRHNWATSLSLFTFMHWRRKWQPTPVFSPGESQGWGSLMGCCLLGHTESDMTEAT